MNLRVKIVLLLAVLVLAFVFVGAAEDKSGEKVICPVMKNEVKDIEKAPKFEYEGKTYYFCCPGCVDKFKADPEKYIGDNQEHPEHAAHMEHSGHDHGETAKNNVCPVMGNEIKDHSKAPKIEYEGKTYYFCCAGCVDEFNKDPEKYIAKLNEKVKCPVSGEEIKIADASGSYKHGDKTYYFCCDNCEETFKADPDKYTKGCPTAKESCGACADTEKK